MSELITHISDDTFDHEVLNSETPVLLDFWAEWCGPCKAIAPALEDLAKDYEGKLRIVKLNIDHNQKTPLNFGVRGIPTLMVFKNGKVEATQIGAVS
ncbi:MAG TPA: thioredoxin, partial [Dyella sp.]|uniref:thioredoxin n=1 Tax=Dyella sp. TaxID=1869338 RepID=UPI002BA8C8EF